MQTSKKRLVIELDDDEHMAIKTRASIAGMTMRQYVLSRVWNKEAEVALMEYDKEDVTDSIKQALLEVIAHRKEAIPLPTLEATLDLLEDD
ncbi:MAG: hypothetical protein V3V09_04275 [Arenicellales bacterium]